MSANDRADGHCSSGAHRTSAVGSSSPQAKDDSTPFVGAPADLLDPGQGRGDSQANHAGVDPLAPDQSMVDAQDDPVGGDPPPQAIANASPKGLTPADPLAADHAVLVDQMRRVGGDPSTLGHDAGDTHDADAGGDSQPPVSSSIVSHIGSDGWLELRIWCEQLEDAMQARMAAVNRAERGGVDPVVYGPYIEALTAAEHVCELAMQRCYRRVAPPEIVAWQKSEKGIGDKLTARLLGHLGDPCIATPHHWEGSGANRVLVADEPFMRTVSQLWQYCGVGDPHRRKHKGMTADEAFALGNPTIKSLMYLHATRCVMKTGHYRKVYDIARDHYMDRVHQAECVRCGPRGKPAAEGSPWSKGHQHGAALRKVAKEILRDLWRVRHAALCPPTSLLPSPMVAPSAGALERKAS